MNIQRAWSDRKRILFVDDEVNVLRGYRRLLRDWSDSCEMEFMDCPVEAWGRLQADPHDVVVTDCSMNAMDGLDLLARIRSTKSTRSIPVIMVTGRTERHLWHRALELGAADLLRKPVCREDLVARIKNALVLRFDHASLVQENDCLSRRVRKHNNELFGARLETITRLAKAAEQRDLDTGNHVIRVAKYAHQIALSSGLSEEQAHRILLAAPLHDVGKIGIPDAVLLKPHRLTSVEWEVMKQHCQIGANILSQSMSPLIESFCKTAGQVEPLWAENDPTMDTARNIALYHHERWDGTGYPSSLAGNDIPIEARCVAIADVFDSLRSQRPYKPPLTLDESLAVIQKGRQTHFDPRLHDCFFACLDEILSIDHELRDPTLLDSLEWKHAN
jgi:putative two-component system response regulator